MQIPELAAKVQALGLSDKEAKVYVASLFLGPSPVQKIAQQADVNRATAYVILDQLAELGLVAESTEGKKTVYIAEGPELLNRVFDRQELEIEERRKELNVLLPELLQSRRAENGNAPVVRFYKGQEGVMHMLSDLQRKAKPGSVSYGMVNYDEVDKISKDILKTSASKRLKKQVSSKSFYSYHKELASDPKLLRQAVRVKEPIKADVSLLDDTAALCTYAGKNTIAVVIESKEIVGVLRQLFEIAWENKDT